MEPNHHAPLKIIYADDDEDDREFFTDALAQAHTAAKLTTFEDGEKLMHALEKAEGNIPDIIFLDINMPCKDGKQCLKELRSIKELKKVPVVMFSTSAHSHDIEETFAHGASLYLSKPLSISSEVKMLKRIINMYVKGQLENIEWNKFYMHGA